MSGTYNRFRGENAQNPCSINYTFVCRKFTVRRAVRLKTPPKIIFSDPGTLRGIREKHPGKLIDDRLAEVHRSQKRRVLEGRGSKNFNAAR